MLAMSALRAWDGEVCSPLLSFLPPHTSISPSFHLPRLLTARQLKIMMLAACINLEILGEKRHAAQCILVPGAKGYMLGRKYESEHVSDVLLSILSPIGSEFHLSEIFLILIFSLLSILKYLAIHD